jgi:hypothetical protein
MIRNLRAILAAGLMCLASFQAYAAATLWNPYPAPIFAANGRIAAGAKAYFYSAGTTTPLTVFSDNALAVPRTNPVVAAATGIFPNIYLPYGNYRVRVTDSAGVVISDSDGIANPEPAGGGGGGGGGIVVTADQILEPGDVKWRPTSGAVTGFVRMNGKTLGSASSGATERANADTATLYAFLWNNLSDSVATVSAGRGASAAADFAANKTIVVPSMQGRFAGGLDDMGGTAANVSQRSTTITTSSGVPTATVASATGLSVGMYIVSVNVPASTTITAISGLTVTMSANATGSASGTAARFSQYTDAQVAGSAGGASYRAQILAEIPGHTHTGTTDSGGLHTHAGTTNNQNAVHQHDYAIAGGSTTFDRNLTGSTGTALTAPTASTLNSSSENANHQHDFSIASSGSHNHPFTTGSTGSGNAMGILNPARAGTFYMKL